MSGKKGKEAGKYISVSVFELILVCVYVCVCVSAPCEPFQPVRIKKGRMLETAYRSTQTYSELKQ